MLLQYNFNSEPSFEDFQQVSQSVLHIRSKIFHLRKTVFKERMIVIFLASGSDWRTLPQVKNIYVEQNHSAYLFSNLIDIM